MACFSAATYSTPSSRGRNETLPQKFHDVCRPSSSWLPAGPWVAVFLTCKWRSIMVLVMIPLWHYWNECRQQQDGTSGQTLAHIGQWSTIAPPPGSCGRTSIYSHVIIVHFVMYSPIYDLCQLFIFYLFIYYLLRSASFFLSACLPPSLPVTVGATEFEMALPSCRPSGKCSVLFLATYDVNTL